MAPGSRLGAVVVVGQLGVDVRRGRVGYPSRSRGRFNVTGHEATGSALGIALTMASLILMPTLGIAKRRLGRRLGSRATAGEGQQNLLCAYLAGAVLLGLAGNAAFGWSWLDPVAGLVAAAVAVREGFEAWCGRDCC
jgi:divalent metal cation (Fe/Co/Zn/Cd) transporter